MTGQLFSNPFPRFTDGNGNALEGGLLFSYVTATATKTNTYTTNALSVANDNPIVLNARGEPATAIWLDPTITYRFVLAAATEADPPASSIWAINGVTAAGAGVATAVAVYAGNPNGNVAGTAGTPGVVDADIIFDITNNIFYVCTTSGTTSMAVWTNIASTIAGSVVFSGVISPSAISTQQDNYNPTDLSTAATLRLNPSADVAITGIAGGETGRELTLINTAAFRIVLTDDTNDTSSTAANRFKFPGDRDVILLQDEQCTIAYDGVNSRWRLKVPPFKLALGDGQYISNASFALSVGSNALTIALKTARGTDPSPSDPVIVAFRSETAATGTFSLVSIVAAQSLVVPAGAELGFANSEANLLHIGFINNAGAAELAVSKDGALWNEDRVVSSTTVGTGADSAVTLYSTTGRTSKACRLACVTLITTGATAGNWDAAPTRVSLITFNPLQPFKNTVKCWAKLHGSTAALRDGFNVSSTSDIGTGNAGITFAVAFAKTDSRAEVVSADTGSASNLSAESQNNGTITASETTLFARNTNSGGLTDINGSYNYLAAGH